MECKCCHIHIEYLERIIREQKDQIQYLRQLVSMPALTSNCKQSNEQVPFLKDILVKDSILDIIDYKMDKLDVDFLMSELNNKYPAKQNIINILCYFIVDDQYNHIYRRKNEIKYVDKENKVHLVGPESFSKTVCEYVFAKIKPIIEDRCTNQISCEKEVDEEYLANNLRVENAMILKNNKIYTDLMKQLLNTHF